MKHLYWLGLIAFAAILCGCGTDESDSKIETQPEANPWTHLKLNNDPNNFQFVIVSDRTRGSRPGVFADAVSKINLLQPEFVICVGDLIEGYTKNERELDQQWDEFEGLIEKLQMPFFYVPGNHDITNQTMLKKWKQRLGRTYYHFIYHDVLILCLNTEGGNEERKSASLNRDQMDYFRVVLEKNPKVRWTLVFMHKPLWIYKNSGWGEFEKMLTGRDYTVFAGHKHRYAMNVRQGQRHIMLATTGGRSSLDGPKAGTFDHLVWGTMSDQGPILANLMLDGIYDENIATQLDASGTE